MVSAVFGGFGLGPWADLVQKIKENCNMSCQRVSNPLAIKMVSTVCLGVGHIFMSTPQRKKALLRGY